jgi:hypothetical protein
MHKRIRICGYMLLLLLLLLLLTCAVTCCGPYVHMYLPSRVMQDVSLMHPRRRVWMAIGQLLPACCAAVLQIACCLPCSGALADLVGIL